jgi:hypothetical protein
MTNVRVEGEAIVYRLYDVGYEIRLDEAFERLASSAPERPQPRRGEAQAIHIANPPVTVSLGSATWNVGAEPRGLDLSARLFDFGVISMRARIQSGRMRWDEFISWGIAIGSSRPWELFEPAREALRKRLSSAIDRPGSHPITEEYLIFRIHRLSHDDGSPASISSLEDSDISRLLLGEPRAISPAARAELMSERLSYFEDDVTVLTWNAALVVEAAVEDTDIQYVLEFANAQLLELRYYDTVLDHELPRINDEIVAARRGFHVMGRRYSRLLSALQTQVADATEAVGRVENALKVTEDVFLARVYAAALGIFRERAWRAGIDRKVSILRQTYEMLNAESLARRTEVLEIVIILLIVLEVILALFRG